MEIEERAQKFADSYPDGFPFFAYHAAKNGYRTGATEQREIDIQRAIKWNCEHCTHRPKCYEDAEGYHCLDGFICTKIDSLKQAIKGGTK